MIEVSRTGGTSWRGRTEQLDVLSVTGGTVWTVQYTGGCGGARQLSECKCSVFKGREADFAAVCSVTPAGILLVVEVLLEKPVSPAEQGATIDGIVVVTVFEIDSFGIG